MQSKRTDTEVYQHQSKWKQHENTKHEKLSHQIQNKSRNLISVRQEASTQ